MIPLTGEDELDLREYVDALEVRPPLVNIVRQAVREFLVKRAREPEKYHAPREWAKQYHRRRCRPLVIVP